MPLGPVENAILASDVPTEVPGLAFEHPTVDEGIDVRAGASMLGFRWMACCRPTYPFNWEDL